MDDYMDLTIAITESALPHRGKYMASLVASNNLNIIDEIILSMLTGYGDTPLDAAAALLTMAAHERNKRG